MANPSRTSYQLALRDFHNARQQAVMQQLLARFRGDGAALLPFEEIKEQLHPTGETIKHGTQEIPLDKIVGSVGRYKDFTHSFLPKRDADQERWTGVRAAVIDMTGIPPIEVYQVGDAYFVQDGNHRVSIARRMNSKTITAYVTEVKTRVPLSADDDPYESSCKAHYTDFLAQTNLDKLRPDADLMMTFCGQYQIFLDQIETGFHALVDSQDFTEFPYHWRQAVTEWYDEIYLPVIHIIRELGVLHRFPDRTEADMYLLLTERRAELEEDLGWQVEMETGVSELVAEEEKPRSLFRRMMQSITLSADKEPLLGLWRQQQLARRRYHHLFKHILIPLDGTEENWKTLGDFLRIDTDEDHILGLHVVPDEKTLKSKAVQQMRDRFMAELHDTGLQGEFAIEVGSNPVQIINNRAAWVDMVVVRGTRPKGPKPLEQASPEMKLLVQHCPRPILVSPDGTNSDYSRAVLAYDGSPKADEALFIATYMTSRWSKSLTVVTVETAYTSAAAMERARKYLTEHGVTGVNYVLRKGPIADMVLETAQANDCNLLFMGGFSFRSLRHLTLGSSAERVLLEFPHPMWICR
jgi:nucleotide-binding universal stress UspA family protein